MLRFQEWPDEALHSVAVSFYADVELSSSAHPQLLEVSEHGVQMVVLTVLRWSCGWSYILCLDGRADGRADGRTYCA